MGLEEIEKLKAKLEKDPNSKVFLPLAEEYRKEGRLDEAIEVLREGLHKYPQYTSARVALGKIYYEKGDTEKAKEVFEEVIKTVPDNLFAQRKLAEIYFNEGNLDKALEHYEKVLELNPLDEEVQSLVAALRGEDSEASQPEDASVEIAQPEQEPAVAELHEPEADNMVFESTMHETAQEEEVVVEPETIEVEENPEVASDEGFQEEVAEEELGAFEEPPVFSLNTQLDEEEKTDSDKDTDAFAEYNEFSSFVGEQVFEGPEDLEVSEVEEEEPDLFAEEMAGTFTTVSTEPEVQSQETELHTEPQLDQPEQKEEVLEELLQQADTAVKEERFSNAMELYKRVLQIEPENRVARQRLEELHLLLKVSGKGQEALIEELERFKEALKSKADEFSGNA